MPLAPHDDPDPPRPADTYDRDAEREYVPAKRRAACYEQHESFKADPTRWAALPLVGRQVVPADEHGPRLEIELRNCDQGCSSTLALEVGA